MGVVPDQFAVFAVDPGGTSGYAQAVLRSRTSTRQTLLRASRKRAWSAGETRGDWVDQAWELFELYLGFRYRAHIELGIAVEDIHLVIEEFELRQRNVELSPVQIAAGLEVSARVLAGSIEYQSASQAMTFATSDRLRDWGVWTVGSEHARDATRHLALRVAILLRGTVE